jgi:decaprenylphospho-beta-D-erythro-pentofuranosid-2-ulose 2-reductase
VKKVLVIGATSAIAEATARLYAKNGDRLYLIARDPAKLETVAADLAVRGAERVDTAVMDACEYERHEAAIKQAIDTLEGLDIVLIAHGTLPDQKAAEENYAAAYEVLNDNFLSVVSLLTRLANIMESNKQGTIAVISSVAGDRGRQSNYLYGTAKAGVSTFLQGLRNRLQSSGVHVVTVKPGFVNTPMTADVAGDGFMWAQPEQIADGIYKAIDKKRDVVYLPGFWWLIMFIIRSVPEFIFKRLSL